MNILEAMDDPNVFAPWFKDGDWTAWRAFLAALFGLDMTDEQRAVFQECTGLETPPASPQREVWTVAGRRGGKSFILALVAVYLASFFDYRKHLSPGERGTVMVIASDKKQARVIMGYIGGLLEGVPMLAGLIDKRLAEAFHLNNRITIEVQTASFRRVRGYTVVAALCDEIAFWRSEDSSNPDFEILDAIRPATATIPNAMLLCASSPYARRGALWDAYNRMFGKAGAHALVWKAPTLTMNPSVPVEVIEAARERDPAHAAAEYDAEFRSDIADFISREAVEACIERGVSERRPNRRHRYVGFIDPSGGSSDSMTMGICHREGPDKESATTILDAVRERRPPFSPEQVVEEFSDLLRSYRVTRVYGDRYAGEWCVEQFRKHGVNYEPSPKSKSQLYVDCLPLINSTAADLLDNPHLVHQFAALERKTARGGRDSIDHPPGGHDDLANAVAGALVHAQDHRPRAAPHASSLPSTTNGPFANSRWMAGSFRRANT